MTKEYESLGILLLVNPVEGSRIPCFLSIPTNRMFPNLGPEFAWGLCYTVDSVYHFDPLFRKAEQHRCSFKTVYILFLKCSVNSLCMLFLVGWIVLIVLSPICTLESSGDLTRLTILRISEGDVIVLVIVRPWHQYFLKAPWGGKNV